ncbi:hypothetical protein VNI00_010117 [Paramarasmius palmivorus]|uniref:Uncharacterized protein n=1 Tax=Paramarasmius palmivorus TaxID=297713 RepID=A0AAW0CL53_9AGAR
MKSVKSIPLSELKIKASSGSQTALLQLGKRASQRPQLLLEVLPVFLNHLPFPLPKFAALKETQRDERLASARHSLVALGEALESSDALGYPKVLDEIEARWDQLREWISFLSNTFIITDSSSFASQPLPADEDRDELHRALARLMSAFIVARRTMALLFQQPSIFPIAIQLYIIAAQNPPFSLAENKTQEDTLLYCSRVFNGIQMHNPNEFDWMNGMLGALNSTSPSLASGVLRRIIHEISKPTTEEFNSRSLKQALTILSNCTINSMPFNLAFIDRRSIYWVCLTMRRISGRKARFFQEDFYYIADCLKLCAMYLEQCFRDFGHAAVIQALQGKLLSSLLKSADFILVDQKNRSQGFQSSLATVYKNLLHITAGYAMYYSVAVVLRKSLRCIEERRHAEHSKSRALDSDFKAFKRAVEDRITVGYEWSMHGMNYCANSSIVKNSNGISIRKHAKRSGRSGSTKAVGSRLPPMMDMRDKHFSGWLVQQYILQMRPTLLSQQAKHRKKLALPPTEPLVSVLDYTEFPCKVDTITISNAKAMAPDAAWNKLLVEAREKIDEDPLVLSLIPNRYDPETWVGFGKVVAP